MISPANLVVAGLLALIAVVLICVKNIDRLKAGFQTAVPAFDKVLWVCWYLYSDTAAHSDTAEGGKHNLGCTPGGRCRSCIGSGRSVCRFLTGVTTIVDGIITMLSGLITFITGVLLETGPRHGPGYRQYLKV